MKFTIPLPPNTVIATVVVVVNTHAVLVGAIAGGNCVADHVLSVFGMRMVQEAVF